MKVSWRIYTPIGKLNTSVRTLISEFESDLIRGRISDDLRVKAGKDIWAGGNPPYNYRIDPTDRWIYGEAAAGKSCRVIADKLNLRNVPTPYARDGEPTLGIWTNSQVRHLIRDEMYKGVYDYGTRRNVKEWSKKLSKEVTRLKVAPPEKRPCACARAGMGNCLPETVVRRCGRGTRSSAGRHRSPQVRLPVAWGTSPMRKVRLDLLRRAVEAC